MATVTEQIAVQIVVQRKTKKLTPRQRALAKQCRDELFEEYAMGNMIPEKKAMILSMLGSNFFAPVDKFERQCLEVEAYLERKAQAVIA
jgi:hypothetical protein